MSNSPHEVLIVDDEPNVRLVFRTALESAGYGVSEANDGDSALALIQRRDFSVVLLDLRMPHMDGLETLRQLRNQGSRVPVVIVTAHGSMPDVVAAMRLGAVDFIPKPLSPETLRRVVRESVELGLGPGEQSRAHHEQRLSQETMSRASQAVQRGELDEAEFFLRLAIPLGADSAAVSQLESELKQLRQRKGPGAYRVAGGLTWG
jgi:DNA-binding NtrC family response regulator